MGLNVATGTKGFVSVPVEDRFWSKVERSEGCWRWRGHCQPTGHGQFWMDGRTQPAHSVAYRLTKGAIPAGLEIDHLCRNPSCVRPDHLEAVTHRENMLRSPTTKRKASGNPLNTGER